MIDGMRNSGKVHTEQSEGAVRLLKAATMHNRQRVISLFNKEMGLGVSVRQSEKPSKPRHPWIAHWVLIMLLWRRRG